MANCKQDFLRETKGHSILCATITYGRDYWSDNKKKFSILPVGFSRKQYMAFLKSIDYEYDSGYGGQEVFGTIWYKDGTWSERYEYDGAEWWEYKSCPKIPKELKGL